MQHQLRIVTKAAILTTIALVCLLPTSCGDPAVAPTIDQTKYAVMAGRVVSGRGLPVAGATVVTDPAPQGGVPPVTTDDSGRFVINRIPWGSCTVTVTKADGSTSVEYLLGRDTVTPTIILPRWRMVWNDEFNGTDYDTTSVWDPADGPSGVEGEDVYYDHNRISVGDGRLRMNIIRQITETQWWGTKHYRGAAMNTREAWTYGRFAVRARLPRGKGVWPSIWLWPLSAASRPEIDIMENLGHQPEWVYMTYHYDSAGVFRSRQKPFHGPDYSQEFHEFAVDWFPTEIRWYIDGVETNRTHWTGTIEPLHLIITANVGGKWPGYPDSTTPFPTDYDIDYARVYEAVE
jgi:hypothetical protein